MNLKSWIFAGVFAVGCVVGVRGVDAQGVGPKVFLVDPGKLAAAKAHPDAELLKMAKAGADRAMKQAPVSVTMSKLAPGSDDKHDYVSMARYFWPNPATANHLPYVQHDGQSNPEIHDYKDHEYLDEVAGGSRALALGWYLTGDERYAGHAAVLLRTFFLTPETAMNPNLEHAQFVPGKNTGRGTGVLDARGLAFVVDAVGMLAGSKSWSAADQAGMVAWMSAYYQWLTTSEHGKAEANAANNHGSWYAAQAASIAMFLGKTDDARKIAERVREERIPAQIDAKGDQKLELARTNSFSYSAFNLEALTELAAIVSSTGVDLYKPAKAGDVGILVALNALMPYDSGHAWPHQQISKGMEKSICSPLARAAAYTGEAKYVDAEKRFDCETDATKMLE